MLLSGLAGAVGTEDTGYEIVYGQRVEVPPMGAREVVRAFDLAFFVEQHVRPRRLGRTVTENLFVLDRDKDLQRRPDMAFVSHERWPREREVPSTNAWDVVPDLVAEVVSPTNLANEVVVKVQEYLRAGVRLVWVIYPVIEQVYAYESPTAVRIFERDGTLDGGRVLAEFRLPLTELFERPSESSSATPRAS